MHKNTKIAAAVVLVVALMGGAAAVASYTTRTQLEKGEKVASEEKMPWKKEQHVATAQPLPRCDDKNIVGTVAGGAAGGVIGNQFGKGSGKTAATIAGIAGGALLGNEYIPTRNVTCR